MLNSIDNYINSYRILGYEFEISSDGYRVAFNGEFIYAAGTLLKDRMNHRKNFKRSLKDLEDNKRMALITAERHHKVNTKGGVVNEFVKMERERRDREISI